MKWKDLPMPKEVRAERPSNDANLSRFVIEPLERGYGATLGNSLRRVLLSSIQGAAPVSVRITGVPHEFATLDGVYEDVTDIILNIKNIRVLLHVDEMKTLRIKRTSKGKITAGDLETGADVEILNRTLPLLELTSDREFEMEIDIASGRAYTIAEQNRREDAPAGTIYVDSFFSPVTRAWFNVESTRVGQRTDYDRLIINVETDGSITAQEALCYSAKILKDHLQLFIHLDEDTDLSEGHPDDADITPMRKLLNTRVEDLELSVRSANCLRAANIQTLEELVTKAESEMLKFRNFGRKSLNELNQILSELNLDFGMDIEKLREQGQL